MRHDAIRQVYPNAKMIDDSAGVFDFNRNKIDIDHNLILAKIAELEAEKPMELLRIERTRLLQQSDWMANSDVVITDAWKAYRQALRDLPATAEPQLDSQGNLTNVDWPEVPQ